ncbi:Phytanoyl-CoA dioxygenase domain-containing protein 1 [Penicillium cosmopolitanum]|uniref:Phytanoyl-CoA dioxygenase domain-containing protein 1 n=1 Tax=Penicillium cosmopolitanum TaxID=1131564 RepID=A0A9W9W1P8_9EURO|nr:Phytanoyl-CoA dioxygenase domain-containing protein 1 [Penicillium cosmopolitanum]KAJ5396943.1 Phytanoyl-CoA dioxygenase domain-containing protein 1 [Penicillium cosmopolitanum]
MVGLTPEQVTSFQENGYLVLPDYLSPEEITSALTETNTLLDTFSLESHPLTQFTTGDGEDDDADHVGDDYFLTSGDKIRYFFEPDAFTTEPDPLTGRPALIKPKNLAVNKIGHSLHTLSPPFKAISLNQRNADVAKSLGFKDPRVLQSMVILKQPSIGGAVPAHRDSEFLYTDPPSAVGWWYALQDARPGNATLGMWKGSHKGAKGGHITRRFVRKVDGAGTEFVENTGPALPKGMEEEKVSGPSDEDLEILDIKAGSLVLIHGNVLHKSEKNTSPNSRFAYTFHVIEGAEGWEYDRRNWLQPPEEGFSRLLQ